MPDFQIRPETAADETAITTVTVAAFLNHAHSEQTEHFIVQALRQAGMLTVSLVAEAEGEVVGHVAFSPVNVGDGADHWFGLGPVSVRPDWQGFGVGSALIRQGLAALRSQSARGCVVLGEPGYYSRLGFRHSPDCRYPGVPAAYFQILTFRGPDAVGEVTFHAAFGARG